MDFRLQTAEFKSRSYQILALYSLGFCFLMYKMGILAPSCQGCKTEVSFSMGHRVFWRQQVIAKQKEGMTSTLRAVIAEKATRGSETGLDFCLDLSLTYCVTLRESLYL